MPEGPEVARMRDFLEKNLVGKKIFNITVIGKYSRIDNIVNEIISKLGIIQSVTRKGKHLFINGEQYVLHSHLGMTGWWSKNTSEVDRVIFHIFGKETIEKLYFRDSRKWAFFNLFTHQEAKRKRQSLGLDVMDENFNFKVFHNSLKKRPNMRLDVVLMKQGIFCSIGNYLKSEILYESKIDPHRTIDSLDEENWLDLYECCHRIPREFYLDNNKEWMVYSQKKCKEGHTVETYESPDKRTTHWCCKCQV